MLRLHGSGLLHERFLALEREDGPGGRAALAVIPTSIGGVAVICQMDEVSEVGGVFCGG